MVEVCPKCKCKFDSKEEIYQRELIINAFKIAKKIIKDYAILNENENIYTNIVLNKEILGANHLINYVIPKYLMETKLKIPMAFRSDYIYSVHSRIIRLLELLNECYKASLNNNFSNADLEVIPNYLTLKNPIRFIKKLKRFEK